MLNNCYAAACHAKTIAMPQKVQSFSHPLVLDVAPLETAFNALHEWWWDSALELRKVVGINLFGETESGINNGRVQCEEVLRNAAGSRVLGVESADADLRRAFEVLLEVDAALREDGALELCQGGVELGSQAVLEHEASLDVPVGGDGEEFRGARVDVGSVQATRVEEEHRG